MKLLPFIPSALLLMAMSSPLQAQQVIDPLNKFTIDPEQPADTIWHFVNEMPEFPGGFLAIEAYIKDCTAKEKWPVKSSVFLQMIVERDGSLSGIKVIRSSDEYLSAKAVECAKSMPTWQTAWRTQARTVYLADEIWATG
jgi:hypothetical protein